MVACAKPVETFLVQMLLCLHFTIERRHFRFFSKVMENICISFKMMKIYINFELKLIKSTIEAMKEIIHLRIERSNTVHILYTCCVPLMRRLFHIWCYQFYSTVQNSSWLISHIIYQYFNTNFYKAQRSVSSAKQQRFTSKQGQYKKNSHYLLT